MTSSTSPSRPRLRVVAAEIERDGRFLITQRRENATMPLLWEFPGGRVESGEQDIDALRRELNFRLGVDAEVIEQSLAVAHEYERYTLDFVVYRARIFGEPRARAVADFAWVAPDQFDRYEFPGADQASLDLLLGLD